MDRIQIEPFSKKLYRVTQDYFYADAFSRADIKAGFTTNGANIPRIFWSIFAPYSPEYITAAVIHDYLCANAKSLDDKLNADKSFYLMLLELNVNNGKAWLFYKWCKIYHRLKWFFFKK